MVLFFEFIKTNNCILALRQESNPIVMKRILAFLFPMGLLLSSCSTDFIDNFAIRISPELMKHTASIQVLDAQNEGTRPQNLKVVIEGPNANDVYDIFGAQDISISDGFFAIGLHPRANPLPGTPTVIPITITADGYLTRKMNVTFYAEQTEEFINVNMVNIVTPPPGIGFGSNNGTISGDTTSSPVVVEITPTSGTTTMDMSVPSGTRFFNRQGNQISGSNLNIEVAYFGSENPDALAEFPGGLSQGGVRLADGSTTDAFFLPVGFSDIEMTLGGTEVKSFSDPISVSMDISPSVINPETSLPYVAGDLIDIWSYDEVDGFWVEETRDTVELGDNGLEVQFTTTHLSVHAAASRMAPCAVGGQSFQFELAGWPNSIQGNFRVGINLFGMNIVLQNILINNGYVINTPFPLPTGRNFSIDLLYTAPDGATYTGSASSVTSCGTRHVLSYSFPVPPAPVNLTLSAQCPTDPSKILIPTGYKIRSRKTNAALPADRPYTLLATIVNGQASASLVVGQSYDFRVALPENTSFDTTVTVTKLNYNFVAKRRVICDQF